MDGEKKRVFDTALKAGSGSRTCRGTIFSARVNRWVSNNRDCQILHEQMDMRRVKRMSCPGCELCDWVQTELKEFRDHIEMPTAKEVEPGRFYRLKITELHCDPKTGAVTNYSTEFVDVTRELESRR